jgi:YD repeat-containing protein
VFICRAKNMNGGDQLGGSMLKRLIVSMMTLTALLCLRVTGANAQAPAPCTEQNSFWFGDPIPAGYTCETGQGPFMLLCTGPAVGCGAVVWCPTCNQFVPTGGQPINLTNGNTYIQQNDVNLPGLGGGLRLDRTWSSIWPASQAQPPTGLFGPNWRSTFEEAVSTGSSGVQYSRSDGSFWIFGTNGSVVAPSNVTATLSSGSTYWTIAFQNGEQRRFDNTSGSLIAIIDRNGNTTQLAYDGTNRLTTVTDAAGRHLYFNYSGSSSLVTGVTSDVGLTLAYSYDTQGRLSQITKPDLTTISFQYNSNSLISAVLDSNGKVLESHTYDSKGRGLTSSRANGVEAVTVSYIGE